MAVFVSCKLASWSQSYDVSYVVKIYNATNSIARFRIKINAFFFVAYYNAGYKFKSRRIGSCSKNPSVSTAPFFESCINEQDLDEMNIEIIRNTLYKSYLESFYNFCKNIGGETEEVMCEILAVRRENLDLNLNPN
jgi:hypothetical protein